VLLTVQLSLTIGVPSDTPVAPQAALAVTTTSAAGTIDGPELSTTLIVWFNVAVLPAPSVTVQVMEEKPNGKSEGPLFTTLATLQLSFVITPKSIEEASAPQTDPALTVTTGGAVIVGLVVSITVTV
jgi:hypothetical protein